DQGAPTLTLTDSSRDISGEVLRLPGIDEEWLSPIPAIVVAQLFTWLTLHQGNDPDNPRGLEKVTRTT
ncbi:MAG: glucosamine--fructose-6-phosphate aminotransferase, partial [Actinomycetota bacterium]